MKKKVMETNNVMMYHLLLTEDAKGKHRRNCYCIISAHQKYDHPAGGHPDCLAINVMEKAANETMKAAYMVQS